MVSCRHRPLIVAGSIILANALIIGSFVRTGYSRCQARTFGFGDCGGYSAGVSICNVGTVIGVVLLLTGVVMWAGRSR